MAVAFVLGLRAALAALLAGGVVLGVHGLRGGDVLAATPALLGLFVVLRLLVTAGRDQALGLRLTGDDQPELAAFVDGIARQLGTDPPEEIWLTPEVDAFATVRRTLPLLGRRRRILGLGLGTLAVVSVDQARAVIVHELAHLDAADTRPSRWLRGAQSSLSIAAASLGRLGGTPCEWLSRALHRLAGPVFRQEELDADAAAVAACGSDPVIGALQRIDSGAALYDRFAAHYVEPLWRRGMAPTHLVEGFRSLRAASPPPVADDQADQAEQGTHPPVAARIAHAEQPGRAALAGGSAPGPASWPGDRDPDEPAWSLLDRPDALDLRVSRAYTAAAVGRATEVAWERVTPEAPRAHPRRDRSAVRGGDPRAGRVAGCRRAGGCRPTAGAGLRAARGRTAPRARRRARA